MARYEIDPARSVVHIEGRSSVHPIHSRTDGLTGWVELTLRADGGVSRATKVAGALALPVERLKAGNPLEERELRRRLDARRHPTIDGVLTAIEPDAVTAGAYRITGDVTVQGTTNAHTDLMTIEAVDDDTIRLAGTSTFDVRRWGIDPPRVLMLKVDPEVTVSVEILAVRSSDA